MSREALEEFASGLGDILSAYFRIGMHGVEHLPRRGPAILIANHSGFEGLDAIVLRHMIRKRLGRRLVILAHPFYFRTFGFIRRAALRLGLREANLRSGFRALRKGELLLIFPEGERGNFKSSLKRYHLQRFRTGFVSIACRAGVPVIPCVVTGAEEASLNFGSMNLGFLFQGLRIPIPLNLLPLPSKWGIRFLKPFCIEKPKRGQKLPRRRISRDWVTQKSERIRGRMQKSIETELRHRKYVFFARRKKRRPA